MHRTACVAVQVRILLFDFDSMTNNKTLRCAQGDNISILCLRGNFSLTWEAE